MKLSSIEVQNFLGVADFRHALSNPMLFIAGGNGSGKSSLQDAIRFGLTGELVRGLTKVGERSSLISEGASAGFVAVTADGYGIRRNIGSGKTVGDAPEMPASLALCLEPSRFARLPEADRRKLLFELSEVKVDRNAVAEQLAAAKVPAEMVERILPVLRNGFPAAADYAKEQASQARGAWKATTGETYGSQKAVGWAAAKPETMPSPEQLELLRGAVRQAEAAVERLVQAQGRSEAGVPRARRLELKSLAAKEPALAGALHEAQAAYEQADAELKALENEARTPQGVTFHCPNCQAHLSMSAGVVSEAGDFPPPSVESAKKLPAARAAFALARDEVTAAQADLQNARAAKLALENLPEEAPEPESNAADINAARLKLQGLRDQLRNLESSQQAAAVAEGKTRRAAEEHAKVEAWSIAAQALSQDGIPAVLLSKALDPINAHLAARAVQVGWQPAQITRELVLTYAGRPYSLCSESEQWRADALFATAIAGMSGAGIIALDRFDVLEPAARGDALDWLADLATDLGTVIVSATLKSKPDLGEGIDVVWLGEAA